MQRISALFPAVSLKQTGGQPIPHFGCVIACPYLHIAWPSRCEHLYIFALLGWQQKFAALATAWAVWYLHCKSMQLIPINGLELH